MANSRTGILIILDGFGINPDPKYNAVALARTPTLEKIRKKYPVGQLEASESNVGLPAGFMGNSEVGHLNIGAGRIVYQDFSLISRAIQDESFFRNSAFLRLLSKLKETGPNQGSLHLMGLVSDGGVHSHLSHLFALLQLAKKSELDRVFIHAMTDGRDTSPTSGNDFLRRLQDFCLDVGIGKIATVSGRFYAMDRDSRWERTEKAYKAIICGKAPAHFSDPVQYVQRSYQENTTDEFIVPGQLQGYSGVKDGDAIIFFNFRADRARQLTRAIFEKEFTHFDRGAVPKLSDFVTMTPYDDHFPVTAAFEKPKVPNTLGEILSRMGWKQLRIAETEKYAHVTYFFNGGEERVFDGEKRVLIPSPRDVRTYDLKPEMSAQQVTQTLLKELKTGDYQFVVINFANPDMVGHTGNIPAAVKAVEVVDSCLGEILDWVEGHDGFAVVTADHGNCEKMQDEKGMPLTSHTLLPVPFILVDPERKGETIRSEGKLCDIAPTLLQIWGIKQPPEMTGKSLLNKPR